MEEKTELPTVVQEANFRLSVKASAKGVIQPDFSVRADTIEELTVRVEKIKALLKVNGWDKILVESAE